MKCSCGGKLFMAHQICRHDVIVNAEGTFHEDKGIYDSEKPYGPFTCMTCGEETDELLQSKSKETALTILKKLF